MHKSLAYFAYICTDMQRIAKKIGWGMGIIGAGLAAVGALYPFVPSIQFFGTDPIETGFWISFVGLVSAIIPLAIYHNRDETSRTWQEIVGGGLIALGILYFVFTHVPFNENSCRRPKDKLCFLPDKELCFRFDNPDCPFNKDRDPIRTAFALAGAGLVLINIGLVIKRLKKTDEQIDRTNTQIEEQRRGHYLQMQQHGIDMLYGKEKKAFAGVSQLHGLAEKHGSDERKDILDIFCLFIIATSETDKKERASRGDDEDKAKVNDVVKEILKRICKTENIYPPEEINLAWADLRGADLQEANLQKANLQWADLQGKANLWKVNLQKANLQWANLQEADLQGANLQGANLQGAYLQGADLRLADLQRVDLKEAHLNGARLHKANLQGADLRLTGLQLAQLEYAYLGGTNLRGAYLQKAKLNGANLSYAIVSSSSKEDVKDVKDVKGKDLIIWHDDTKSKPFTWNKEEYTPEGLISVFKERLDALEKQKGSYSSHAMLIRYVIEHIEKMYSIEQ